MVIWAGAPSETPCPFDRGTLAESVVISAVFDAKGSLPLRIGRLDDPRALTPRKSASRNKGACLLFGLTQRVTPSKSWKPTVVSIRTDPFAPRLDRECGEIRVLDDVAFDAGCPAKTGKNLPVPSSRGDQNAVWSIAQGVREREGHLHRALYSEHARMGDHAEKPAQNEIG